VGETLLFSVNVKHSTLECTSELQSMNVSLWVLTQGGKTKPKNSLMASGWWAIRYFLGDCETQYARVYKRAPIDERVTLGSRGSGWKEAENSLVGEPLFFFVSVIQISTNFTKMCFNLFRTTWVLMTQLIFELLDICYLKRQFLAWNRDFLSFSMVCPY